MMMSGSKDGRVVQILLKESNGDFNSIDECEMVFNITIEMIIFDFRKLVR